MRGVLGVKDSRSEMMEIRVNFSQISDIGEIFRVLHCRGCGNTISYSASAYLIIKGVEASTHTGIKTAFNKELISTSILPASFGSLYNKLFNLRQDADYRDYRDLTKEDIGSLIQECEDLVLQIETLIKE